MMLGDSEQGMSSLRHCHRLVLIYPTGSIRGRNQLTDTFTSELRLSRDGQTEREYHQPQDVGKALTVPSVVDLGFDRRMLFLTLFTSPR